MSEPTVPSVERTMGALLSLVTHDLRNPLSVLLTNIGYLDSVLAQGDVEEARTVLADLGIACDALTRYISNLDALAASLSSRPLAVGRASVASLVASAVEAAKVPLEQQSLEVIMDIEAGCPDVLVDADLAARGLENLLANAAVFAPRGSRVHVGAAPVALERVRFTVSDRGPALPPGHRVWAFREEGQEILQREASSRYGRGLGLLTVGIVARRLGGSIDAPDAGAEGCRFELELPTAPPDSLPDSLPRPRD